MSKYGAIRTEVDGFKFASKKEAGRYSQLKLLERAGEITELRLQPRYPLTVNGVKVCTYVGDFAYRDKASGFVLEDVKGVKTETYKLKAKLFAALHGFPITEV